MDINGFLFVFMLSTIMLNLVISLYGVFARPSLIKKIIALTILSDSGNVLAIAVGFRDWPSGWSPSTPPVLNVTSPKASDVVSFARVAVDPLPQALVLTAVVIGLAVMLFLVFLTLQIYRLYGTTDVRKVAKLKG
ncbi:MAG: Na+/H+ antiporter subunit C [Zestosphaera tikiterensis]|uniref:Na+/H+ antiporter subunit C n=1 Tax=Zestosphaera tikiterensis TaxID=1973259 RepID=A0A2R7Y8N4_9CREN|nr:MAG: Na+/H+ antiporter subunit C [Zestosphaera tikiterensis]